MLDGLAVIWLVAELGVWCTARPVYHFGASGLTYGMMSFVFIVGIMRRDRLAISLSLLVFFLYGTMIWGCSPINPAYHSKHICGEQVLGLCAHYYLEIWIPCLQENTMHGKMKTMIRIILILVIPGIILIKKIMSN